MLELALVITKFSTGYILKSCESVQILGISGAHFDVNPDEYDTIWYLTIICEIPSYAFFSLQGMYMFPYRLFCSPFPHQQFRTSPI